ncbi:hypothetical protein BaRGS_00004486 [Batillaria attramentaria]|uniref:Sulfatase N-terminal domain-containing protein n=1 Tax=Batillaria attramentaria TaxID=370345 RepID=A0ABD0LXF8_9CAEN
MQRELCVCLVIITIGKCVIPVKGTTPNLLFFVADDLGYGDLGCFGNDTIRTPNIDRLAAQGVRLTQNLAADTLCTPSRAAFLTGRYPIRSGMSASHSVRAFMYTASAGGLPANETTFAEVAKSAGYTTALLGKWHQGWSLDRSDPEHHHPLNQGFDYFYGVPLTNMEDFMDPRVNGLLDHFPNVPFQLLVTFTLVTVSVWCLVRVRYVSLWLGVLGVTLAGLLCGGLYLSMVNMKLLNSFMFRNFDLVEQPIHLPSVTSKLVMESQQFLQARHADNTPFLLVVSWLHVHIALVTAPQFRGRSQHGLYGDAVEEMDWGVGQVLGTLDQLGFTDNTLVYFTSDHGGAPRLTDRTGRHVGGHNGPFKGSKGDGSTEGSFRVPGIVRWPGKVSAGHVIQEPISLMDMLPTVASLLHVPLPSGVTLDGKDMVPLLTGQTSVSPHGFLFHYCQDQVHAVRYRPEQGDKVWKLALREPNPANKGPVLRCDGAFHLDPPHLYDITLDPGETSPVDLQQHADIQRKMLLELRVHLKSVVPVPSQFTLRSLIWQPWKQPCCTFPKCSCQDKKFLGRFDDW